MFLFLFKILCLQVCFAHVRIEGLLTPTKSTNSYVSGLQRLQGFQMQHLHPAVNDILASFLKSPLEELQVVGKRQVASK